MSSDQNTWLKHYRDDLETIVTMQGPSPALTVIDDKLELGNGASIALRFYRPGADGPWPTLLFIHGGGFVAGSLTGYDIPLRWLARRSQWQIAAVDYRLAPEHPFPTAPDDCTAALRHLFVNEMADKDRIAVGGDSCGGLLATVVARRARDAGLPLALQVMLYPNADLRETATHASRAKYDGTIVRIDELYRSLDLYLGPTDRSVADVSPLLAPDLRGLCPAMLVTSEYDPLRDEAEAYGERLREAGVSVEGLRLDGMIHSILQRGARIDRGDALIALLANTLRATGRSTGDGRASR